MRWVGHVSRRGEERKLYKVLVRNPEGKRPMHIYEYGIRIVLREIGFQGGLEWIQLAQDRDWWQTLVNTVMSL
jgi:hypothetical protein